MTTKYLFPDAAYERCERDARYDEFPLHAFFIIFPPLLAIMSVLKWLPLRDRAGGLCVGALSLIHI